MNKLLLRFCQSPKQLIGIDALGALLTATLLLFIAKNHSVAFGIPASVLTILSLFSLLICCYSTICFLFLKKTTAAVILSIAAINAMYCLFSFGLILTTAKQPSVLALVYFTTEILVILCLIRIEVKVSKLIGSITPKRKK